LAQLDAGATGSTATGQPGLHASDFNGVSDSVSWSDPIAVPVPQEQIAGADDRIIGTWRDPSCDPSLRRTGCAELVITRTQTGDIVGEMQFGPAFGPAAPTALGPFPPAEDPSVGYPVGLTRQDYSNLRQFPALGFPYRVLDGHLENDQLSFGWSTNDLWHAWCRLQTPSPWSLAGRGFFFCVPSAAEDRVDIDQAKLLLCTPSNACVSLDPSPACACSSCFNVCRCESSGCDADLYSPQRLEARLTLTGGRLSGALTTGFDPELHVTLEQVSP
jgi:hypothetical protein